MSSTKLLAFFFALSFLVTRSASAQRSPDRDWLDGDRGSRLDVRGFGETALGARTFDLDGMTLRTAGTSSASKDRGAMRVDGSATSTLVVPTLTLGAGLTAGPVIGGVEIGVAMGGGASGPARRAGDIDVRPSGFVGAMIASAYLGVALEKKHMRYRLDGVLGSELIGLGMERPGFDDTRVNAVNGSRWTLGPRARVDFRLAGGGSLGVGLGCDARNPGNVMLGLVLTTL